MKLREVKEIYEKLLPFAKKKLPIKLTYAISKNLTMLEKENILIEQSRLKLVDIYVKKDEEGNPVIVGGNFFFGENQPKFIEDYKEYLETEIELELFKVPEAEIEKIDDEKHDALSPEELIALECILEREVK